MTRKEEIKKASQRKLNNVPNFNIAAPAFRMGAMWADEHPHWISVEDELPPLHEHILIVRTTGQVDSYILFMDEEHRGNWIPHITHWMPMLAPPKKGGEE